MKKNQSYKSHRRFDPLFHFVTLPALLLLIVGSFVNLFISTQDNLYAALLIFLGSLIIGSLLFHNRKYALKVQNRIIRTEENLRHFTLTGKPLDKRLRFGQIIALRFASDDEFVMLAQRAVEERLRSNEIKKAIKHWRGDYHRV